MPLASGAFLFMLPLNTRIDVPAFATLPVMKSALAFADMKFYTQILENAL